MRSARSFLTIVGLLAVTSLEAASAESVLVVSTASSLQDVIRDLARIYETIEPDLTVRVNAGGSSFLARQIEEGAPVDLFVSADDRTVEELIGRGWIDSTAVRPLCSNRVVIVSPSDRSFDLASPSDLASASIGRIALCDSTVPIGRYASAFLKAAGIETQMTARTVRTENVRASLAAAVSGAVDLAFVYETDARTTRRVRIVYHVPHEMIPSVRAFGGPVVRVGAHRAAAERFLSFLRGPEAGSRFSAAGFQPIADDTD